MVAAAHSRPEGLKRTAKVSTSAFVIRDPSMTPWKRTTSISTKEEEEAKQKNKKREEEDDDEEEEKERYRIGYPLGSGSP